MRFVIAIARYIILKRSKQQDAGSQYHNNHKNSTEKNIQLPHRQAERQNLLQGFVIYKDNPVVRFYPPEEIKRFGMMFVHWPGKDKLKF